MKKRTTLSVTVLERALSEEELKELFKKYDSAKRWAYIGALPEDAWVHAEDYLKGGLTPEGFLREIGLKPSTKKGNTQRRANHFAAEALIMRYRSRK